MANKSLLSPSLLFALSKLESGELRDRLSLLTKRYRRLLTDLDKSDQPENWVANMKEH